MRQVAVLGIGQTSVDEHWDKSLREIGGEAAFAALQDAGVEDAEALFVGNMLSPMVSGQSQLGAFFSDWIGMWRREAVKVEAACGSGAAAFRAGLMAVASGDVDSALVIGVEKMTDKAGHDVTAALATAADADYEGEQGVSFVGLNALIMRRYMYEYGWKHGDFAAFSINAHNNAVHNPYARLRETWGEGSALLISAGLSSLMHLNAANFVPFMVVGAFFALLMRQTRSLWTAILAHGLFNLVGLLVLLAVKTQGVG